MKTIVPLLIAVTLFATGCANTELTRRYKSAKWVSSNDAGIEISAFVIDPPTNTTTTTLQSLHPEGQAALVEAIAIKSKSTKDLLVALGKDIGAKKSLGMLRNKTYFKKRVVLSATRIGEREGYPADRIHSLRWIIKTKDPKVTFVSWDKFSTTYETVDLGKVTLEKSQKFGLELKAGEPTSVAGAANFEAARTLGEEISLKKKYVDITGILSPDKAILFQQGVVGIDLAGNSFVDLKIKVPPKDSRETVLTYNSLRNADDTWKSQEDIKISTIYGKVPGINQDVTLDIFAEVVVRKVVSNDKTIIEGDDCVEFVKSTTPHITTTIVPAETLIINQWIITTKEDFPLNLKGPVKGALSFGSYKEAQDLKKWILEKGNKQKGTLKISGSSVVAGADNLLAKSIKDLKIKTMKVN